MKRLISLILCMVLLMSMGMVAHADFVSQWKNAGSGSNSASCETDTDRSSSTSSFVSKWANNGSSSSGSKITKSYSSSCTYCIELPDMDKFFDDELQRCYYDRLEDYVHLTYDTQIDEDLLEEYIELLEDYGFELYIDDCQQGVYGFEYTEACVETFYPGYGYKDECEVAFLICCADGYTHVYYSTDFEFEDTGERTKYEIYTTRGGYGYRDCA